MNDTPLLRNPLKNWSGLRNFSEWMTPENLEKGVAQLKQPAAIAIIASLGLHGLLGISLPVWSGGKDQDAKKVVKLVDLTPAEQSHLPTQATATALPPLQLPQSSPGAAFGKSLFQPLPDSTFNLSLPNLNTPSSSPAKSSGSISPDFYLKQSLPNLALPSPEPAPTPATPVPPTTPMPPGSTTPPSPEPTPSATPSPSPSPAAGTPPTAPQSNPTPSGPAVDPARATMDQKARMFAGVQIAQQLSSIQQNSGTSTSGKDLATRYTEWLATMAKPNQSPPTFDDFTVYKDAVPTLVCQRDECAGKSMIFAVAIDPTGQILGNPAVIQSTGDKVLDQQATQIFLDAVLPKLQKPSPENRTIFYSVPIDVVTSKPS